MEQSCQNHRLMSTVQFFQLTSFAFLPIQAVSVCKKRRVGGTQFPTALPSVCKASCFWPHVVGQTPRGRFSLWICSPRQLNSNQDAISNLSHVLTKYLSACYSKVCCYLRLYLPGESDYDKQHCVEILQLTQDPKAVEPHFHEIPPDRLTSPGTSHSDVILLLFQPMLSHLLLHK